MIAPNRENTVRQSQCNGRVSSDELFVAISQMDSKSRHLEGLKKGLMLRVSILPNANHQPAAANVRKPEGC